MALRLLRDAAAIANGLLKVKRPRLAKRVIAFHEVGRQNRFREKLEWLKQNYRVVTLAELITQTACERTSIALTFDDGYSCWHEKAAPVLEELRIPALFFVCSGFVGSDAGGADWFCRERLKREQTLRPLTRSQLEDLANHPLFEIGSHTRNHVDLGQDSSDRTLEEEIGRDREQLQCWTGKQVEWFAFPFGAPANVHPAAKSYLQRSAFRGAFTLVPGFIKAGTDSYAMGRDGLEIDGTRLLWRAWLNGGYDGIYALKERLGLSSRPG